MAGGVHGVSGVNAQSYAVVVRSKQHVNVITPLLQTVEEIVLVKQKKAQDAMNRVAQVVAVEVIQAQVALVSVPQIRTEQSTSILLHWYGMRNWQGVQKRTPTT